MQILFYQITCKDCGKVFDMITAFADFKHLNCPVCAGQNLQIERAHQKEQEAEGK